MVGPKRSGSRVAAAQPRVAELEENTITAKQFGKAQPASLRPVSKFMTSAAGMGDGLLPSVLLSLGEEGA